MRRPSGIIDLIYSLVNDEEKAEVMTSIYERLKKYFESSSSPLTGISKLRICLIEQEGEEEYKEVLENISDLREKFKDSSYVLLPLTLLFREYFQKEFKDTVTKVIYDGGIVGGGMSLGNLNSFDKK